MDVNILQEYTLFIKDSFIGCKKKPFEIIYHEPNYCSLISKENVDENTTIIHTPVFVNEDQEELSFRGFIKTCDIDNLKLGLQCVVKNECRDVIVDWSVSFYNTSDDECVVLGDSKIYLSAQSQQLFSSEIKVAIRTIEKCILENPLVLKWSIETLPSSLEPEAKNEVQSGDIDTGTSIDSLMQHLSNKVFKDEELNKKQQNVKKEMLNCQNQQNVNEVKLRTIENQCLAIDERVGQLLERMDLQEQSISRELSQYTTLPTISGNGHSFSKREIFHLDVFSENDVKLKRSSSDSMLYVKQLSRKFQTEDLETCTYEEIKTVSSTKSTQTHKEPPKAREIVEKHEGEMMARELEYQKLQTEIPAKSETEIMEQEFFEAFTVFEKDIELESFQKSINEETENIEQETANLDLLTSKLESKILLLNTSLDEQKRQLKLNIDRQILLKKTSLSRKERLLFSEDISTQSMELEKLKISIELIKKQTKSVKERLKYNQNRLEQLEQQKESISKRAIVLDTALKDFLFLKAFTKKTFKEDLKAIQLAEENLKKATVSLQRLDHAVLSKVLKIDNDINEEMTINITKMQDCFEGLAIEAEVASTKATDLLQSLATRKRLAMRDETDEINKELDLFKTHYIGDVTSRGRFIHCQRSLAASQGRSTYPLLIFFLFFLFLILSITFSNTHCFFNG